MGPLYPKNKCTVTMYQQNILFKKYIEICVSSSKTYNDQNFFSRCVIPENVSFIVNCLKKNLHRVSFNTANASDCSVCVRSSSHK